MIFVDEVAHDAGGMFENGGIDVFALAGTAHARFVDQQDAVENGMLAHQILRRRDGLLGARLLSLAGEAGQSQPAGRGDARKGADMQKRAS